MNNLTELDLKSSYESGKDDLIEDFYIPVLSNAIEYDRIAGFFSSSSLAIAAKGIAGLINNGGKMRIIACPRLNKKDAEILSKVNENPLDFLTEELNLFFSDIEDGFQKDHIRALGWMLANGLLEIKIAYAYPTEKNYYHDIVEQPAIFHQKVGIIKDKYGNKISFSGSINETASGWLYNIEEFKVFKSWEKEQKVYLDFDISKFEDFWNDLRPNVKVFDLPDAVRNNLIQISSDFQMDQIVCEKYKEYKINSDVHLKEELGLFFYQKNAIKMWKENDRKLLFQMATGTGKTRTAIGCMYDLLKLEKKLIIIVSCPQGTLSLQWKKEISNIGLSVEKEYVIDGTNSDWKNQIQEVILKVEIGYNKNSIIYTTHITGSKPEFIDTISRSNSEVEYLFVGDEAHGLGASITRKGLLERYKYRVALSATPSRWFDESGTRILENYFGNKTFEFSINDALTTINPLTGKTFLVPYYYCLEFVNLTNYELENYRKLSNEVKKISKYSKDSDEYAKRLENLIFKRANIIKRAENKYGTLSKILDEIEIIKDLIIFVSYEQIETVLMMLNQRKISAHRLTQNEGTTPKKVFGGLTERQHIIENFKKGYFKVLVAIKCLDEGIDIPSASSAILMASSTNPREYIQRIGRVIRQAPGKEQAVIYDITIKSCAKIMGDHELEEFEKMIFEKEKNRIYEIADNAINNSEAITKLFNEMGE